MKSRLFRWVAISITTLCASGGCLDRLNDILNPVQPEDRCKSLEIGGEIYEICL